MTALIGRAVDWWLRMGRISPRQALTYGLILGIQIGYVAGVSAVLLVLAVVR